MFQFPAPGAHLFPPRIPLTEEELGSLLCSQAHLMALVECPHDVDGACENCRQSEDQWWELYSALGTEYRGAVLAHLTLRGIPLPEMRGNPWAAPTPEEK